MNMDEYDVIVVGAGPAGGNCSRELSQMERSVLLLERSEIIGIPNFSTGGTPNETMEVFNLPKKVTDSPWSSVLFASKNERAEYVFSKRMGYVLNYKLLKQFLAKEAKKKGCEIVTGAIANDVILKNDFVCGVKFSHEGEKKEVFAKIVVDATGGRAMFSQKLGLIKFNPSENLVLGVEHHMNGIQFERKERMDFYLGPGYIPYGYAWIFPMGQDSAKVGVGILKPTNEKIDLMKYLKRFAKTNPQTKVAVVKDTHAGSLFANGGIKNHVLNGFIAIGDAACQINPIAGEGIRHALYSGRFAAESINSALESGVTGKKNLSSYNEMWKKYVGNKWKISMLLNRFAYNFTQSEKLTDVFVRNLRGVSPQTMFDICFNYKFELGTLHKKILMGSINKILG